jgi:hypothetical protein
MAAAIMKHFWYDEVLKTFGALVTVRARPRRLRAVSIFHSTSVFVWRLCMGAQGA